MVNKTEKLELIKFQNQVNELRLYSSGCYMQDEVIEDLLTRKESSPVLEEAKKVLHVLIISGILTASLLTGGCGGCKDKDSSTTPDPNTATGMDQCDDINIADDSRVSDRMVTPECFVDLLSRDADIFKDTSIVLTEDYIIDAADINKLDNKTSNLRVIRSEDATGLVTLTILGDVNYKDLVELIPTGEYIAIAVNGRVLLEEEIDNDDLLDLYLKYDLTNASLASKNGDAIVINGALHPSFWSYLPKDVTNIEGADGSSVAINGSQTGFVTVINTGTPDGINTIDLDDFYEYVTDKIKAIEDNPYILQENIHLPWIPVDLFKLLKFAGEDISIAGYLIKTVDGKSRFEEITAPANGNAVFDTTELANLLQYKVDVPMKDPSFDTTVTADQLKNANLKFATAYYDGNPITKDSRTNAVSITIQDAPTSLNGSITGEYLDGLFEKFSSITLDLDSSDPTLTGKMSVDNFLKMKIGSNVKYDQGLPATGGFQLTGSANTVITKDQWDKVKGVNNFENIGVSYLEEDRATYDLRNFTGSYKHGTLKLTSTGTMTQDNIWGTTGYKSQANKMIFTDPTYTGSFNCAVIDTDLQNSVVVFEGVHSVASALFENAGANVKTSVLAMIDEKTGQAIPKIQNMIVGESGDENLFPLKTFSFGTGVTIHGDAHITGSGATSTYKSSSWNHWVAKMIADVHANYTANNFTTENLTFVNDAALGTGYNIGIMQNDNIGTLDMSSANGQNSTLNNCICANGYYPADMSDSKIDGGSLGKIKGTSLTLTNATITNYPDSRAWGDASKVTGTGSTLEVDAYNASFSEQQRINLINLFGLANVYVRNWTVAYLDMNKHFENTLKYQIFSRSYGEC